MLRLVALAMMVIFVYSLGRRFLRALEGKPRDEPARKQRVAKPAVGSDARAPHEVLGVEADASEEAIRRAYQSAIRKYHPDYLENMAPELRKLAEQRTKEINQAYEALRRRS